MASPPPNPKEGEEGGAEFAEETGGERATAPQKTYVAPPASQLPTKLQYVALGAAGPSGSIKQCYRTVKAARRVPTLPRRPRPDEPAPPEPERRLRRDRHKRHLCTTCDKRFSSPGKLSQHVLSHTGELPFSCELCDKKFNSKFKLVRHGLIHSEARNFACTTCGKTFNRKDHLTNHIRVHNPIKKLYTCDKPDCRKSYTSLLSYRKHAALHSAEEGDLQCKICDETFATRQEIVYHLKFHTGSRTVKNETDKKFTCDFCQRRFFTAKDVRRHLVVHTGRRDFLCPYCPQKFGRKDHLVRHVKNAHPEESWRSAAVGTSKEPPPETTSFEERFPEFPIEDTDFDIWKSPSPEESASEGPTRVPSSDIIEEIPPDLDIKVEPLDINVKLEEPTSPGCELLDYPVVYMSMPSFQESGSEGPTRVPSTDVIVEMPPDLDIKVETVDKKLDDRTSPSCELLDYPVVYMSMPPYPQTTSSLPYITTQPLSNPLDVHLLDPAHVQSLLMDPGEGPSGLSSQDMLGLLEDDPPPYSEESRVQQRLPAFTQAFQSTPRAQSPKPPPPPPPPH